MKKLFFVLLGVSLLSTQSCKNAPEGSPIEEQSIETVSSDGIGDKVLIRLKPKVGDSQNTLMTMNVSSEGDQKMSMDMVAKIDVNISEKVEDVYTYNMNYKSIKMDMSAGGMEMKYDSENPGSDPMGSMMHEQFKAFLDKPMSMKMNDRGMISDFVMPGNIDVKQAGDFGSFSIPLPEGPVGEGDSWEATRPMQGTGNMNMKMTVNKITANDIVIDTNGDLTDSSGTNLGNFTGSYTLDRNSGLTKDGTMNMDITAEGQKLKMKLNFKPQ